MLTGNKIYGVETVLLVLMGGARGVVVGFRHSPGPAPPQLPDYVVVEFLGYSGDPVFQRGGREKWAPIPIPGAFGKTRENLSRAGLPLILCWSISVVKSHGLTLEEVLVNLCTMSGRSPIRLPGLAYVAFSRMKSFAGFACRGIPPLRKSLQCRENDRRRKRVRYEKEMGALRDQFAISQGAPPEELAMHLPHLSHRKMADLGRAPTSDGNQERVDWLLRRGVLAPPPDVGAHCANEKAAAQRGQSFVFGNFPGGRGISLGAKLSELIPKSSKTIIAPPNGGPVIIDEGVSECLVNESATSVGIPATPGVRRFSAGVTIRLRDESTGPESNFRVAPAASGAKGFRSMLQSSKFGGWRSFRPSMESL